MKVGQKLCINHVEVTIYHADSIEDEMRIGCDLNHVIRVVFVLHRHTEEPGHWH